MLKSFLKLVWTHLYENCLHCPIQRPWTWGTPCPSRWCLEWSWEVYAWCNLGSPWSRSLKTWPSIPRTCCTKWRSEATRAASFGWWCCAVRSRGHDDTARETGCWGRLLACHCYAGSSGSWPRRSLKRGSKTKLDFLKNFVKSKEVLCSVANM